MNTDRIPDYAHYLLDAGINGILGKFAVFKFEELFLFNRSYFLIFVSNIVFSFVHTKNFLEKEIDVISNQQKLKNSKSKTL